MLFFMKHFAVICYGDKFGQSPKWNILSLIRVHDYGVLDLGIRDNFLNFRSCSLRRVCLNHFSEPLFWAMNKMYISYLYRIFYIILRVRVLSSLGLQFFRLWLTSAGTHLYLVTGQQHLVDAEGVWKLKQVRWWTETRLQLAFPFCPSSIQGNVWICWFLVVKLWIRPDSSVFTKMPVVTEHLNWSS